MSNVEQDPICTKRAARRIGVTPRTLEQWRHLGKGPPFLRIGRMIRYLPQEVDAWVKSMRFEPMPA